MDGMLVLSVLMAFAAALSVLFAFKLASDVYWRAESVCLDEKGDAPCKWHRPEYLSF